MVETTAFNANEQKVQDILRVIKKIEPVIGILREMYRIEDELLQIHEECIENNGKIEAFNSVLEITSDKDLITKLSAQIKSLEQTVQEDIFRYNTLDEVWDILAEELEQYVEYVKSFKEFSVELVEKVLIKISEEDENIKKFITAILLFTNENIKDEGILEFLLEVVVDGELNEAIEDSYANPTALYSYICTTDVLNE